MGYEGHHLSVNPIIDFSMSSLNPGTPEWDAIKSQVLKAGEDYGCFIALLDRLGPEVRKGITNELKHLFDLPTETKMLNLHRLPLSGYVGQLPIVPSYESLGIGDPSSLENIKSFSDMLRPEGRPSFSENVELFTKPAFELESLVKRIVLESLGVDKYLDELKDSTSYNLRVMRYEKLQNVDTDELGLVPHYDKNFITILHQLQSDGLELETKDGEWIKIKPSPGSFIVLFGESFHAWTNGRLRPGGHRVVMSGDQPRYSMGLFSDLKEDFLVKAPDELVDEEHPLIFKHFKFKELVNILVKEVSTIEVPQRCNLCVDAFRNV
ncbi:hypothetical protein K2173_024566 [Erythroxylum novogranatense]|uniref:Fe2OG dioxygenase domain-containing protein n=1 Tax=Erythroxylum novogranatense TaxID=1862640 RepID=A0AAV8SVF8_9ROSI|nr:hypothetical protein K2173_024566 [Erythroxylum novogranatense]